MKRQLKQEQIIQFETHLQNEERSLATIMKNTLLVVWILGTMLK